MKDSNDLFELCKQVYEATGWRDTLGYIQPFGQNVNFPNWFDETITKDHDIAPLYTSDYLLEKLPNGTTILKDVQGFKAWNVYNRKRIATYTCDLPVEALLKLTLKLHEEKVL